jgi:hypothetical protein
MACPRTEGQLTIRRGRVPVAAETEGDRVRAVSLRNVRTGNVETVSAHYVLDATELGTSCRWRGWSTSSAPNRWGRRESLMTWQGRPSRRTCRR